ncbi:unnamed protein product [Soboliphyme baturini]|uniref:Uncharacterized protein n=1 Tax=Soboliphyme baturini TaxID=241478 RepID=A0A183J241_9BILA|nr:unnamed protein product [Soboliphyme baturini]
MALKNKTTELESLQPLCCNTDDVYVKAIINLKAKTPVCHGCAASIFLTVQRLPSSGSITAVRGSGVRPSNV